MTERSVAITIVFLLGIIPALAQPAESLTVATRAALPAGAPAAPIDSLKAENIQMTGLSALPALTPPGERQGGDTCETALPILELPFHDTGSTCGYTNDYDEICPYPDSTAPDVAYSLTPQSDVTVDISLCNGSSYDTKLYVYEGTCPGTLIACNDDACPGYISQVLAVPLIGGSTYFIIVDGYNAECGNYVLDVAPIVPPLDCEADAFFGQPPHMPADGWSAGTSAVTSQFTVIVYENYSGVSAPICGLSWWGLSLYYSWGYWVPCDPAGMTFEIKFYEPGYMPGAELASYQVTPTITDTGLLYNSYPLYEFRVLELTPCVSLPEGWISIQSQQHPADCAFLWMSARSGLDGHSWQNAYGYLANYWYDNAFCLTGVYIPTYGACCDDNTSTCTENIEALDCTGPGTRFVANAACADLDPPCGLLPGACCHPDATCDLTVQADCADNWLGPGTTCYECPCIVLSPPDATLETEECGQDTNGGCNMVAPVFEPLAFGQTVYGTVWNDGSSRDTDWYEITITEPTILHITLKAEFHALFGFAEQVVYGQPGCDNITGYVNPYVNPDECEEITVSSLCVPPGTYYAVVTPVWSDLVACPTEYWLRLTGDACVIPTGACCQPDGSCTQMTQFDCTGYFWGNGTPCETAICTGACCYMDGTCSDTSELGCAGAFNGIGSLCANTYCPVLDYGDTCPFPLVLDNPTLPFVEMNTTCGRDHDYYETCLGDYDSGEDIIYKLTLPADTCVKISVEGEQDWHDHIGIAVDTVCPPGQPCLAYATTTSRHCFLNDVYLLGGVTYYIMIDTAGSPYCINYTMTIEDCPPPQPGTTCENPIVLTDPSLPLVDQTMTCGFGNDYSSGTSCLGWYDYGEDVIYKLQFSSDKCISITVDGATWLDNWIGVALDTVCPPGNPCLVYATSDSGNHVAIQNIYLDANVPYYLMVDTGLGKSCIDYTLQIDECPPPPPGDDCQNPIAVSDVSSLPFDTTRATFDGPGVCQNSKNVWYCYTATTTGPTYFGTCGSWYGTKLAVYDGCACWGPLLGCNAQSCDWQSELLIPTVAGQQYLVEVGGYQSGAAGQGFLTIYPAAPCPLTCPSYAVPEQEACGENTNGGCAFGPTAFEPLAPGVTVCGSLWDDGYNQDADWYQVTLDSSTMLTFTVQAEFKVFFGLAGQYTPGVPGCENLGTWFWPFAIGGWCAPTSIHTAEMSPGTYYFYVAPQFPQTVACPAAYTATLSTPLCRGDMNCDGWIDFADINPFVQYLSDFAGWQATYPACNPRNGDINGDGLFGGGTFADINPFVTLLSSGPLPIVCP